MRLLTGSLLAAGTSMLLSGCLATQSQLKHVSDVQAAVLDSTRATLTADLNNERAQRASSDSALARQLGMVRGDVTALRSDLEAMKKDFGAKIMAMEDGLHFAMPVNFAYDDASVRTEDESTLNRFSNVVQKYYPGSKVTIEGFADPAGT